MLAAVVHETQVVWIQLPALMVSPTVSPVVTRLVSPAATQTLSSKVTLMLTLQMVTLKGVQAAGADAQDELRQYSHSAMQL